MSRFFLISTICLFTAHCSGPIEKMGFYSRDTDRSSLREIDDSDDEEITAIPPTVISGSYLVCQPRSKDVEEGGLLISCFLEKNGSILTDIELFDSDIGVYDNSGENLLLGISIKNNGELMLQVKLNEMSDLDIVLEKIGGVEITDGNIEDSSNFKSKITMEEITQSEPKQDVVEADKPADSVDQSSESDKKADGSTEDSSEDNSSSGSSDELGGGPSDCSQIGIPGSWVLVPGDSQYGTDDFCIMKYEAKCSLEDGAACTAAKGGERPLSRAEGLPWTQIEWQVAKDECSSLGSQYHLVTNNEWMTISKNVATVASNWLSGIVGDGGFRRGHSDSNPPNLCPASADDALNVVEGDCVGQNLASDDPKEQRTLSLSNGQLVWDLSGNVWELIDFINTSDKPTPAATVWTEYINVSSSPTMSLQELIPQIGIDGMWGSDHGIGKYFAGENGRNGYLRRGGMFSSASIAGIFTAYLDGSAAYSSTNTGFRCAFAGDSLTK